MAVLKAHNSFLKSNGKVLVKPDFYNFAKPVNEWTIPSYSQSNLRSSGDTFYLRGRSGWYEVAWCEFVVEHSGSYEFSYDYEIPFVKFWASTRDVWCRLALYIASNNPASVTNPNPNLQYFFENTQNRMGSDIIAGVKQADNLSGHINNILNLSPGRYWIWFPASVVDDYIDFTFTFRNILVKYLS